MENGNGWFTLILRNSIVISVLQINLQTKYHWKYWKSPFPRSALSVGQTVGLLRSSVAYAPPSRSSAIG